ncbi:MAG: hypothetical protein KC912_08290 [Proteobacteria bacterium]|nr:hypothetical protein [Pseudomonadota bacterium]
MRSGLALLVLLGPGCDPTNIEDGGVDGCGEPSAGLFDCNHSDCGEDCVVGRAYALDFTFIRFVEPEGVGSLLGEYLEDVDGYLSPTAVSATELDLLGASGDGARQSVCDPTVALPTAAFDDSRAFAIDATGTTTSVPALGVSIPVTDLVVSGTFSADGSSMQDIVFAGLLDTRPLVPLVDANGQDDTICDLSRSIGVDCKDCGNGQTYCLDVFADGITASWASDTTLAPLEDVCAQPDAETLCVDACVNGTVTPICSVSSFGLATASGLWLVVPLVRRRKGE